MIEPFPLNNFSVIFLTPVGTVENGVVPFCDKGTTRVQDVGRGVNDPAAWWMTDSALDRFPQDGRPLCTAEGVIHKLSTPCAIVM